MVFSAIKNIKIQCGIEGKLMKKKCSGDAVAGSGRQEFSL